MRCLLNYKKNYNLKFFNISMVRAVWYRIDNSLDSFFTKKGTLVKKKILNLKNFSFFIVRANKCKPEQAREYVQILNDTIISLSYKDSFWSIGSLLNPNIKHVVPYSYLDFFRASFAIYGIISQIVTAKKRWYAVSNENDQLDYSISSFTKI